MADSESESSDNSDITDEEDIKDSENYIIDEEEINKIRNFLTSDEDKRMKIYEKNYKEIKEENKYNDILIRYEEVKQNLEILNKIKYKRKKHIDKLIYDLRDEKEHIEINYIKKEESKYLDYNKTINIKNNIKRYENYNKIYKFTKKDIEGIQYLKGVYDGEIFGGILPYDVENIILSYVRNNFKEMIMKIKPNYNIICPCNSLYIKKQRYNYYKFNNVLTLKRTFIYYFFEQERFKNNTNNLHDNIYYNLEILKVLEYIFQYNTYLIENIIEYDYYKYVKEIYKDLRTKYHKGYYEKEDYKLYNKPFDYVYEYNKINSKNTYQITYLDHNNIISIHNTHTIFINIYEKVFNILNNDELQLKDIHNFLENDTDDFEELIELIDDKNPFLFTQDEEVYECRGISKYLTIPYYNYFDEDNIIDIFQDDKILYKKTIEERIEDFNILKMSIEDFINNLNGIKFNSISLINLDGIEGCNFIQNDIKLYKKISNRKKEIINYDIENLKIKPFITIERNNKLIFT